MWSGMSSESSYVREPEMGLEIQPLEVGPKKTLSRESWSLGVTGPRRGPERRLVIGKWTEPLKLCRTIAAELQVTRYAEGRADGLGAAARVVVPQGPCAASGVCASGSACPRAPGAADPAALAAVVACPAVTVSAGEASGVLVGDAHCLS